MTYERLETVVASISLEGAPIPTGMDCFKDTYGVVLRFWIDVPDACGVHGTLRVGAHRRLSPLDYYCEEDIHRILWKEVRGLWVHELAEHWRVAGKRTKDPHVHGEPL